MTIMMHFEIENVKVFVQVDSRVGATCTLGSTILKISEFEFFTTFFLPNSFYSNGVKLQC